MEENGLLPIDEFLKKYDIDSSTLTNKEKLKILKDIKFGYRVDKDYEENNYSKIPEDAKTQEIKNEYLNTVSNLEYDLINVQWYILMAKYLCREERKLKRKQVLQKVIGVFKK